MINARIYIKIFMAILFLGMMPSCTYDTIHVGGLDEHANVTLSLSLGDQSVQVSRAAVAGEGTENVINTVDLFFYKQTEEQPLVINSEKISLVGNTLSFSMQVDEFNDLFDINKTGVTAKTECQVYAIVNRGTNALPADDDYSLAKLQEMVLYAAFVDENGVIKTQDSFVMDGLATVNRSESTLSGTIPLTRAAAKIGMQLVDAAGNNTQTLTVKDANGDAEWTANASAVQISLRRGSSRSFLAKTGYSAQSTDIFSTAYTNLVTGTGAQTKYVSLYTYPTNWSDNENARTHLMVKVTWTNVNTSIPNKTTYYEVNVNPADPFLQRNYYYQILQEISVLGSENEEEPVTLENASYKVLGWGAASSQGNLLRQRYLVVDETSVEMQNIVEKTIYFDSSDPIDLTNVEVLWNNTKPQVAEDLSMATAQVSRATNATTGAVTVTTSGNGSREVLSSGDIKYTITNTVAVSGVANRIQTRGDVDYKVYITIHNADATIPNDRAYIKVQHNLDNKMESTSDYTVYTINLNVAHQDNASYKEAVNIKQYPMLSIVADRNYDNYDDNDDNDSKGFVYINGTNSESNPTSGWQRVHGLGYNTCPNRYIVTVSTLNEGAGENYIIGDPRTSSRKITINNNQLANYLPTDKNADPRMISPQFMFASSYGACPDTNLSIDNAERRCATYQEDGYPAGRWRVPTRAEVMYAANLYVWGVIPELFSNIINYWSAQGLMTFNNGVPSPDNGTSGAVRCVYDTWYWGTDHEIGSTTYTYDDTRD